MEQEFAVGFLGVVVLDFLQCIANLGGDSTAVGHGHVEFDAVQHMFSIGHKASDAGGERQRCKEEEDNM